VDFLGNLLVWVVLGGGVAGWIASMVTRRNDPMGCWANIAVGIVGAFLGGFFNLVGQPGVTGFNRWSFLVALVDAFLLLTLLNIDGLFQSCTHPM
jgi:uncharacterized membrane protein YeaQ/YmgE (transglycosylase-associated protein family)